VNPVPHDPDVAGHLAAALGGDDLNALRRRLSDEADRAGVLDLAYRVVESPVGDLLVVTSPSGLVRVAFDLEDHDLVLTHLAEAVSPRILRSATRTDEVARELDEYFEGARRRFDVAVDLRLASGFRAEVLTHLLDVPYGTVVSYGELARTTSSPRAARAVGTACATNPVPIVVPCHRVVRSGGALGNYLGGYLGGPEVKVALLELEGAL
jgi:methylated-DNA-[protein]-cysteine S-methyltransferase